MQKCEIISINYGLEKKTGIMNMEKQKNIGVTRGLLSGISRLMVFLVLAKRQIVLSLSLCSNNNYSL